MKKKKLIQRYKQCYFFVDILVVCCRVLTHRDGKNFFENEKNPEENYNILKESVIDDHKNLFTVNNFISNLTTKLEEQSIVLNKTFDDLQRYMRLDNEQALYVQSLAHYNEAVMATLYYKL